MIWVKGGPLPDIDSVSSSLTSRGISVISNSVACCKNLFFDSEILIVVLCRSPNSFFIINYIIFFFNKLKFCGSGSYEKTEAVFFAIKSV